MTDRDKSPKAQDIFEQSTPVFGSKGLFEEVFPEIEEIAIEATEFSMSAHPPDVSCYSKKNLPGAFINCSNHHCYNGGYNLGSFIRSLVRERKTEGEDSATCRGYEGSPKGRRKYKTCVHSFEVKVTIKYKEANQNTETL